MRRELEEKFRTRWPEWFSDLYGDPRETCLCYGFEHRDGWFDLVWQLCEQIESIPNKKESFKVAQVKQKFGGLRFNFDHVGDAFYTISALVTAAELVSFDICEVCGQPGYLIGHNRTRCDTHYHLDARPENDQRVLQHLMERNEGSGAGNEGSTLKPMHRRILSLLTSWLAENHGRWGIRGSRETSLRVGRKRIRVPDVVIYQNRLSLIDPPLVVVEILSHDDFHSDMEERARDYQTVGIKTIWVINLEANAGHVWTGDPDLGTDAWTTTSVLTVPETLIRLELEPLFSQSAMEENR
jgi:hypothetical protein